MSMSQEAFNALQAYNKVKDEVQTTLETMQTEEGLAALIASSTKLAQAIAALHTSVKYRKKYVNFEGSDSGHAARLEREQNALALLNAAASDKNAKSKQEAQKKAAEEVERKKKLAIYQNPQGYPTIGESIQIQPKKQVYVAPTKPAFQWPKPTGGSNGQ